jgi:hypothetical protein
MMITVKLNQLQKSQRQALMHSPARRLLVYGQATVIGRTHGDSMLTRSKRCPSDAAGR